MKKYKQQRRQKTRLSLYVVAGLSIAALLVFVVWITFDLTQAEESMAFTPGDYRTIADGDWEETRIWEIYNGTDWSEAHMPPGNPATTIIVSKGNKLVINDEVTANKVVIEEKGRMELMANTFSVFKYNGKGYLKCEGELMMNGCVLEGNGDFELSKSGTLYIGSIEGIDSRGISGNIQLKGNLTLSKDAKYSYNGTESQKTGNGLPTVISEFSVSNSSGVILDRNLNVLKKLTLEKGCLVTGKNILELGSSPASSGTLECISGSVQGMFRKWFSFNELKELIIPVLSGSGVFRYYFTSEDKNFNKGQVEVKFHECAPGKDFKSPFSAKEVVIGIEENGYYTAKFSNGADDAWVMLSSKSVNELANNGRSFKLTKAGRITLAREDATAQEQTIQNLIYGPDPFSSKFYLSYYSDNRNAGYVQIADESGIVVYSEKIMIEQGKNIYEYKGKTELNEGAYILRISTPSEIHSLRITRKPSI